MEVAAHTPGTAVTAAQHLLARIFLLLAAKAEPVDKITTEPTPQALVQLDSTTAEMAVKVDMAILGAAAVALAAGLWFQSRSLPVQTEKMLPAWALMAPVVRQTER